MNHQDQREQEESSPLLKESPVGGTSSLENTMPRSSQKSSISRHTTRSTKLLEDDNDDILLSPNTEGRIRRMSEQAEAVLDKVLAEGLLTPPPPLTMEQSRKKKTNGTTTTGDKGSHSCSSSKNLNNKRGVISSNKKQQHVIMQDDDDDDDEFQEELNRLQLVSESLRQDLIQENHQTMRSTLLQWRRAGLARYKYTKDTLVMKASEFNSPKKTKQQNQQQQEVDWWILAVLLPVLILVALRYLVGPVNVIQFLFGY